MNTFSNSNDNDTPRGPLTIDDPRLTALALGELKDAALLAEVEKNPELSREMERIRAAAKLLEGAFAEEAALPVPGFSGEKGQGSPSPKSKGRRILAFPLSRPSIYIPLTSAAAVCLLVFGLRNYDGSSRRGEIAVSPPAEFAPQPRPATRPAATAPVVKTPDTIEPAATLKSKLFATSTSTHVAPPLVTSSSIDALVPSSDGTRPIRGVIDGNRTIVTDVLAVRVISYEPYQSKEAQPKGTITGGRESSHFTDDPRVFGALRWNPKMFGPKSAMCANVTFSTGGTGTNGGAEGSSTRRNSGTVGQYKDVSARQSFDVQIDDSAGYVAADTLAGSRLHLELQSVANSIFAASGDPVGNKGVRGMENSQVLTQSLCIPEPSSAPAPEARVGSYGSTKKEMSRVVIISELIPNNSYQPAPVDREGYDSIVENSFTTPIAEPLSTFSIDVDTASYANVRRILGENRLPPGGAVRIEEMLNYFRYDYAPPTDKTTPFAAHIEATSAPWAPEHELVRIALKGYEIPWSERHASNLVFLVDVSGSMGEPNKLPLVKEGLRMLVNQLDARDSVAIVTYAGYEDLALPSTTANNRETILHAIDSLGAGGSTNGAGGIRLAYEQAKKHWVKGGVNRVILCTDGDFNVGTTSRSDLEDLITGEAKSGVFLSIYSYGTDNVQDSTMEQLADKGNGNYGYVDSEAEARRVFVKNASGNFMTIAKDVKIQVEFNPSYVQAYRLIGYENRALAAKDFNDDKKDAGEIGAGHSVTALYEVIPVGAKWDGASSVDALKYQANPAPKKSEAAAAGSEMLTLKVRYKAPDGDTSTKLEFPLDASAVVPWDKASADTRFAASVALFGMELRESPNAGSGSLDMARDLAAQALGAHPDDERIEFLQLVREAALLKAQADAAKKAQPAPSPAPEPVNGGVK